MRWLSAIAFPPKDKPKSSTSPWKAAPSKAWSFGISKNTGNTLPESSCTAPINRDLQAGGPQKASRHFLFIFEKRGGCPRSVFWTLVLGRQLLPCLTKLANPRQLLPSSRLPPVSFE